MHRHYQHWSHQYVATRISSKLRRVSAEHGRASRLRFRAVLHVVPALAILLALAAHCKPIAAQKAFPSKAASAGSGLIEMDADARADDTASPVGTKATATASFPNTTDSGAISGTVLDSDGALIPGAIAVLQGNSADDRREVTADDNGAFKFDGVKPGARYQVVVSAKGFSDWTSQSIALEPSQFLFLPDVRLRMVADSTSITVYASTDQIAVEQVHVEEQQRFLGVIPNFYVVYDSANAAPMTSKLKFQMAMKVITDPITVAGVGMMAGIQQAGNFPNYQQGAKGYGQRFGAEAAGGATNILVGGAILPTLLHQDPRYFYQGTGGTRSRIGHALSAPFICRGDNGNREINLSSMGGDLGATALSMAYYPASNRGASQVFTTFGINTAERAVGALAQEFLLSRFTRRGKQTQ